jgi:hypothetical protein
LFSVLLGVEASDCSIVDSNRRRGSHIVDSTFECNIVECTYAVTLVKGDTDLSSAECEDYLEALESTPGISTAALVLAIIAGLGGAGLVYYVFIEQRKQIQQLMTRLSLVVPSWKNVSGAIVTCRTEPDMEKKADKKVNVGETVFGLEEGEWLKIDDGLYLPVKHPTTGASLFTATSKLPTSKPKNDAWKNVSGTEVRCRTEPDMEKKADKSIKAGETVKGVVEGEWLKTADGLYVPVKHPTTGASLFTATQQPPTGEATNDTMGI